MKIESWHSMESAQVLKELNTDLHTGLNEAEVKSRLEKYGYNELKKEEGISPFTLFVNQFKNILIIILLIATALSAVVGETFDAALILVIVVFCAVLGFIQEYRAERALRGIKKDALSYHHRIEGRQRRRGRFLKGTCSG